MCCGLVLLVTDVLFLIRIKSQVADGCNKSIDAESDDGKENVRSGSAGVSFRLQRGMVDDETTNPTQEESKQETNDIIVLHDSSPFLIF